MPGDTVQVMKGKDAGKARTQTTRVSKGCFRQREMLAGDRSAENLPQVEQDPLSGSELLHQACEAGPASLVSMQALLHLQSFSACSARMGACARASVCRHSSNVSRRPQDTWTVAYRECAGV